MDYITTHKPEGFDDQRLYRVPPSVLKRMRQKPHIRDFLVTDLGYFPVAGGHRVERSEGINRHILIFVEAGQGWLEFDGRRLPLKGGEVLLIPPNRAHAYGAKARDPWKIYWFHFQGKGASELLKWTTFSTKSPVAPCPAADGLRRQFRSVIATVERGYTDDSLLELSRVLINVLTRLRARNPADTTNRQFGRIEATMDSMREQLHAPATLRDYAAKAGLSVSRFSETFREHCGVSPMTYLTELRIQRACELLDRTDLQIGEIARMLGYEDTLYFSRLFSKHTGMAPTAYRQLSVG